MADRDDTDDWWSDTQAIFFDEAEREALHAPHPPVTAPTDPDVVDADNHAAVADEIPAAVDDLTGDPAPSDEQSTEWFVLESEDALPEIPALPRRPHYVTTVVVSHDGAVWLPAVLTTLASQTRPPDQVVGVDTGSTDGCDEQLRAALGADRVIVADQDLGFGEAVAAGLDLAGPALVGEDLPPDLVQWVWLLHDDSASDPACLEALLATADANPSASILGPKILGWHDRRLLLEAGFSITGAGRRFTGLERGEHDQGQHDGVRDVLAVSSAGMLVRRDVWDRLAGFDPELPLFRDDLDFCWRAWRMGERVIVATDAVLHHREASAHGRRATGDKATKHPHRLDREAGAHVLLSHADGIAGPLLALRLIWGSAVRSVAFVLGKDLPAARDEIGAVLDIALHPGDLAESRHLVKRTSTAPPSVVRHLRPTLAWQLRQTVEAIVGIASTSASTVDVAISALESGPTDDDAAFLDVQSTSWVRRVLLRPGFLLFLGLTLVTVFATRNVWLGDGALQGGALLPAPAGAGALWSDYVQAWHDVGPGSYVPSAPYLLFIWLVSLPLLGKVWLAVNVLLLLAVPMAGWSAYFALRGVIGKTRDRLLAGIAYAFLPAVTGAVSGGRLGTAIVAVLLPFVARSLARLLSGSGTMRRAAATALMLAVVTACVPALGFLLLVGTVLATAWFWMRQRRAALPVIGRLWFAIAAPLVLLMPWTLWLFTHPAALLFEVGLNSPTLTDPDLNALDVLLLHPGGPGMSPIWVTGGLVVAGLIAFLRRDRLIYVTAAWSVGLAALALGVVQTAWAVTPPGVAAPMHAWPGSATLVLGASMIGAAVIGVDGLQRRFARANFNILQPLVVVIAVAAGLAPVLVAGFWVPQATDDLVNGPRRVVPAFVAADATGPSAPRTLMLHQSPDGVVRYTLVNGAGPVLGDAETAPPAADWAQLDEAVGYLASGRGGTEVEQLAGYGIRYVLLAHDSGSELIGVLDGESGLRRLSTSGGEVLWRISGVTSRARTNAGEDAQVVALADGEDPTGNPYIDTDLESARAMRVLSLGVEPNSGWSVRVTDPASGAEHDAQVVAGTGVNAWSQAFEIPAAAAQVEVTYDGRTRSALLWLQALALAFVFVLALPSRRRAVDTDVEEVGA